MAAAWHAVYLDMPQGPSQRSDEHLVLEVLVTAAEFNDRCAESFACHALRLDLDDALEIAAEYQIATPTF